MKVQKVSQSITPFAGISFVNQGFNESRLSVLIDNHLGMRSLLGYQYSEIIRAWFDIFFCGGEVAEDIQKYLRPTLENIPSNSVPGADTLHRALKDVGGIEKRFSAGVILRSEPLSFHDSPKRLCNVRLRPCPGRVSKPLIPSDLSNTARQRMRKHYNLLIINKFYLKIYLIKK